MKRYIFLMLAFFLSFTQAFAIGISAPSISASPGAVASVEQVPTKKELEELKGIRKPQKNKVYDLGKAGYNDCVEKIKSHKQARTTK
ncbi:hypothetical protein DOM21_05280 [Bacteriovorax stolpii]|uniref:hypothetical protein n=1 Tax=Bacteriovorax stolpii TaxID=960 RepID=UPI001158EC15|nr:hypothetical protein [Bacteriovorax stolpii]QDK40878.1 hypothetical protein DOM21_05280 [Bacteriovorax stolpii]